MNARAAALRLLGRRDYTVFEMRQKLAARGCDADDVTTTIDALLAEGLLDDRRVASAHLRTAARVKGRGRVRIARELAARGITADIVDETVASLSDEEEASAVERLLVRKRLPARMSMPERRRLFQQLLRRGFRADVIAKVLRLRQDEES
jgi:regulatory protein